MDNEEIYKGFSLNQKPDETYRYFEYDSNGNQIHYKDSDGEEKFYEYIYSEDNKIIKEICYKKNIKED